MSIFVLTNSDSPVQDASTEVTCSYFTITSSLL